MEAEQQNQGSTASGYYQLTVVMAIFVGFSLAVYLSSGSIEEVLSRVIKVRKEFSVLEHMSRFYILLAILLSVQAYSVVKDRA